MTKEIKREINFYHMGNGYSVADRLHEKHGDYLQVAHINANRNVDVYEQLNDKDLNRIIELAATNENKSNNSSQSLILYAAPPCKPEEIKVNYKIK
ncbi:MAG: hypothetical protein GY714_01870 [Desulfobacterales bacterium]|nr:hypothetical protein [Desulfobacterales bacterium]